MKYVDVIYKMSSIFYTYAGGKQFRTQFDKQLLNSLSDDDKVQYLLKLGYRIIGHSIRTVFLISSKKVLKLSRENFGRSQNKLEYGILSGKSSNFLPKVYDHAPDYSWIEVETVRPLKSQRELSTLLGGVSLGDYIKILFYSTLSLEDIMHMETAESKRTLHRVDREILVLRNLPADPRKQKNDEAELAELQASRQGAIDNIDKWHSYKNNPILVEMLDDIRQYKIPVRDLYKIENLGVNSSGHLVFLDVGYNMA